MAGRYKAKFFDQLMVNIQGIRLDSENHVISSLRNTSLFAKALHDTYKDLGYKGGDLAMTASCDYSLLKED